MNKTTGALVEIIVNIVVAMLAWYVFNYVITGGTNEFFRGIGGFLVFYLSITALDMIWKLIKRGMKNKKK